MRIELRNVTKNYGPVAALRGISLSLASGSKIALVGPNGSGKSTLIRALLGMVRTGGEILVGGRDAYRDRNLLGSQLAYVPQSPPQFSSTVGELVKAVRLIRDLRHGEIERCAERLNLDLKAVAGKPVKELSGGMKQKLSLTLALAPRARLLVLDEPTASLDPESQGRFYEMLRERMREATLILSSHRLDEVRELVNSVVVLENGQVRSQSTLYEFLGERQADLPACQARESFLHVPEPNSGQLALTRAFQE